jgi:hypothetical protein
MPSHPAAYVMRKRGQMNRIRGGAAALFGLAVLLFGSAALAQEITGRLTGRVADQDTGQPLGGVTVIVQGPQGEDAALTNPQGEYNFTTLPIGTYTIRFYAANTAVQVEQQGVAVTAERTVRVNAKIASAQTAAAQQTYVITGKAPTVDVGSARIGTQFDTEFNTNVPLGRTYGDVIERAPGAFVDGSGNVSIGGATGLENNYMVNGMNVTGLRYGNLESGLASHAGGSNLPLEFLSQIDVSSGGYQAEYGGAMGGVISTVLKSGTNEWHGSAFGYWSPYWLSADPKVVLPLGSSLGGVRKPDFDDSIGVEVGGPLIKDKLFLWVGFAPQITDTHVLRLTYAEQEDPNNPGQPLIGANGNPVVKQTDWTARMQETHRTYNYAATVDWVPMPDSRLTVALVGTPSFNTELKDQYGIDPFSSDPRTAMEELTKSNTDLTAHWVSKLFDRHWQIDALAGMHYEYFYDRSPYADLNNLNQLQYSGANLWDLEHATGCQPDAATGFVPCPVAPYYTAGGVGEIDKSDAYRWSAELKSTHVFEGGGRHELKYGWHLDFGTMDFTRSFTGPPGDHAFIFLPGDSSGGYGAQTFFTLPPSMSPVQYTSGALPSTDLANSPLYVDALHAYVKSISNAFFLQDSFSPNHLRNLTINAGVRLELQKMYDSTGNGIFSTDNLSPRLSAVYDPFDDGRSKVSVSYGRYYESVPLDVAARYFAGENFVTSNGNLSSCAGSLSNPYNWTGAGEYKQCTPGSAVPQFNSEYAQPNMQGQYHNEIVATVERQVMDDMTVRLDYQHRWLGSIIEDGAGPDFNNVLANPGTVPQSAIDAANHQLMNAMTTATMNPMDPVAQANYQNAQANLSALQQLQSAPKPVRNYDALTLSLNKKFSKRWFARAAYTYSRLVGNYEGLYQYETNYIAPNGSNAYDFPELYVNQYGRLPNDRPHQFKLDGYFRQPVRRGQIILGLSFTARSGQPRNYIGNLEPGSPYQLTFLLPRGDAGRTPTVTQLDAKIAYSRPMGPKMNLEAFVDLFNILNQQTPIATDDNYTFDAAPPIVNGTAQDLKYAKNYAGQPIAKNPNFGQPLAYQTPFNARLGLRLTF